jgi:hypothetical protein
VNLLIGMLKVLDGITDVHAHIRNGAAISSTPLVSTDLALSTAFLTAATELMSGFAAPFKYLDHELRKRLPHSYVLVPHGWQRIGAVELGPFGVVLRAARLEMPLSIDV